VAGGRLPKSQHRPRRLRRQARGPRRPGLFGLVFLLQGAYLAALGLSTTTLLLNLAPPGERSAAIGLTNTLAGLLAFSPVLGGYLADRLGFPALFLLAAGLYALALHAGRGLPEEG
jgi:MFS family permease